MEENTNTQKLSYEQLQEQNAQLIRALNRNNIALQLKRIDYCFKVLENSDKFNSDFVISCADEIQRSLTPPKEEQTEEVKENESK